MPTGRKTDMPTERLHGRTSGNDRAALIEFATHQVIQDGAQ